MSVVVVCRKCGVMLGTWGGIFPETYNLTNEEMGFPDICGVCAIKEDEKTIQKHHQRGCMNNTDFQTPEWVCEIMAGLIEYSPVFILEPTPGAGNLVKILKKKFPDSIIDAPSNFYKFRQNNQGGYHYIVANPPFTPMDLGYKMLDDFFDIANDIVILLPWMALINSERRTKKYIEKGLKKIVHLPRKAFPGSRVQTCILVFQKGYSGDIIFEDAYRRIEEDA